MVGKWNTYVLMCPNVERAEKNRAMVEERRCAKGYEEVELYLSHTPANKRLPSWIPIGEQKR